MTATMLVWRVLLILSRISQVIPTAAHAELGDQLSLKRQGQAAVNASPLPGTKASFLRMQDVWLVITMQVVRLMRDARDVQ
jgi:hypothetical protein